MRNNKEVMRDKDKLLKIGDLVIPEDSLDTILEEVTDYLKSEKSKRIREGMRNTEKKCGRPPLSEKIISKILKLSKEGLSQKKIAKELNVSDKTVRKYCIK